MASIDGSPLQLSSRRASSSLEIEAQTAELIARVATVMSTTTGASSAAVPIVFNHRRSKSNDSNNDTPSLSASDTTVSTAKRFSHGGSFTTNSPQRAPLFFPPSPPVPPPTIMLSHSHAQCIAHAHSTPILTELARGNRATTVQPLVSSFNQSILSSGSFACASLPREPENILELNQSFARSIHQTPVIESHGVDKRTITKSQKILNDKYVLYTNHVLGMGSFGKVVLCYSIPEELYFAAKIMKRHELRRQGLGHDCALLKAHREVEILKKLRHDNIIALHEFIDDGVSPKLYMIFELAAYGEVIRLDHDGTLAPEEEPLPEPEVRRVLRSVVEAVAFAHSKGIAHRDIKPQNILITGTDCVKLCDFGCAIVDVPDGQAIQRDGSVAFLPPELLEAEEVLSRATSNVSRGALGHNRHSTGSMMNSKSSSFAWVPPPSEVDGAEGDMPNSGTPPEERHLSNATHSSASQLRQHSHVSSTSMYAASSFSAHSSTRLHARVSNLSSESSMPIVFCEVDVTPTHPVSPEASSISPAPAVDRSLIDFFKADVWSLGITAFVMLFGRLPWQANTSSKLFNAIRLQPDPCHSILFLQDDEPHSDTSSSCSEVMQTETVHDDDDDDDDVNSLTHLGATSSMIECIGDEHDPLVTAPPSFCNHDIVNPVITVSACSSAAVAHQSSELRSVHQDPLSSPHDHDRDSHRNRRHHSTHTPLSTTASSALQFRPGIPVVSRACISFLRRCLTVDPDKRPTVEELQHAEWFALPALLGERRGTRCPDDVEKTLRNSSGDILGASSVASPVHTSTLTVRVLEQQEEVKVPSDLVQVLESAKHGSSRGRRRLAFFAAAASPNPSGSMSPMVSSGAHHPNHNSGSNLLHMRRSKDDSVIFVRIQDDATVPDGAPSSLNDKEVLPSPSQRLNMNIDTSGCSPHGLASRLRKHPCAFTESIGLMQARRADSTMSDGEGTTISPPSLHPSSSSFLPDEPLEPQPMTQTTRKVTLKELIEESFGASASVDTPTKNTIRRLKHVESAPFD